MSTSTTSTVRDRAITLLGQGVPTSAVALTLGVEPSAISQLLAQEDFAAEVNKLKFVALSKHAEHDARLNTVEETVVRKLEDNLVYMTKPMELVKTLQIVNAAKRRSYQSEEPVTQRNTIVQLVLPQLIVNKFIANIHNQVIQVGEQSLLTMQSSKLAGMLAAPAIEGKEITNVEPREVRNSTDRKTKTA